ncbi:hypothetical protein PPBDW_II0365 [Photobacterium kishitanii]|nr:hypothetical protein PPBDW_II0365 [Photobacterium kishitanii]
MSCCISLSFIESCSTSSVIFCSYCSRSSSSNCFIARFSLFNLRLKNICINPNRILNIKFIPYLSDNLMDNIRLITLNIEQKITTTMLHPYRYIKH